jgi:hypothetical protein
MATLDRWDAVQAELAGLSFAALTPAEVLAVKDRLESGIAVKPRWITG